jgi:hypothetical protein
MEALFSTSVSNQMKYQKWFFASHDAILAPQRLRPESQKRAASNQSRPRQNKIKENPLYYLQIRGLTSILFFTIAFKNL